MGTDDYITKPSSPRELVARARAVFQWVQGGVRQPGLIRAGDLEGDLHGYRVSRARETIHLTRSEFNLLAVLAQHPGQTFSRAQLRDRLHGVAYAGFDRSIDAHVKRWLTVAGTAHFVTVQGDAMSRGALSFLPEETANARQWRQ